MSADHAADRPLCFVVMPFGQKRDPAGGADIDFDRIYENGIRPAVEAAGLLPIRADEERVGGIIHTPMFERLLLCEYAVADLTTANANVFYELGVRHTARPSTTLSIFASRQPIPFDVAMLHALPYELGEDNRFGDRQAEALRGALEMRLGELRQEAGRSGHRDSPVFELIEGWQPDLSHLKTDLFHEQVTLREDLRRRMEGARRRGAEGKGELDALRRELEPLEDREAGLLVDLMLAYRAVSDWDGMVSLVEAMPEVVRRQVMVREQYALALNRRAGGEHAQPDDRDRALEVLRKLERERGADPETCGILGRVHKDAWKEAREAGSYAAAGHLEQAIDAYRRGFQADWRDAYPGINAVTLLDVQGDEEALKERDRLLPVVRFAVEQRLGDDTDYWDHATLLELAVLAGDPAGAHRHLARALAADPEPWMPETTAGNLSMIRQARSDRGDEVGWLDELIGVLEGAGA